MRWKTWTVMSVVTIFAAIPYFPVATAEPPAAEHPVVGLDHGVAVLAATKGNEVSGAILFHQKDGVIRLTGEIRGLTPGKHGFHIHEFGDLRDAEGKGAGGHYNPCGTPHAGPEHEARHVGDLGNVDANADGVAKLDKKIEGASLHFIFGRSIVVHAGEDDLKSQPSGNAGPRVAVGVIGIAK